MRRAQLLAAALGAALCAVPVFAQQTYERFGFAQVERGRYLAILGDCAACHTVPGGSAFTGGLTFATPVGNILSSNITPDPSTGIGRMSLAEFDAALRRGVGQGGKRLYPAMPYPAYSNLTDEDVGDLYAYFMSIPATKKAVVSDQLAFPFSIRTGMVAWNMVNFTPDAFKGDPTKSAEWNRGGYIVEGPGHCGACHSGKNLMMADKASAHLTGSPIENWVAPDITNAKGRGLGDWSEADIVAYLKTGANRFDIASGPMMDVITNSSRHWSDGDLKAVAVYLKSLPGSGVQPQPLAASDRRMVAGARIYADRCQACHFSRGEGYEGMFPRLAGSGSVNATDATSVLHVVLAGSRAVATHGAPTGPAMPSFGWGMTDEDVAHVATYVRNSFGNAAPAVTPSDVASLRGNLRPQ